MVQLDNDYDAREEDAPGFNLIPERTQVKMMLIEDELKPNKNGTGENLKLVFQVVEGEYENKKIFENFVWSHKESEVAVKIARARFASFCLACGIPCPKDTQELHNVPFMGEIGISKGTGGYSDQNTITKFIERNSSAKPKSSKKKVARSGNETSTW